MSKYSKFNIVYLLQKWMDSVAGQTFMNYAYSWGAAVVILGTLFKLTHLPGANIMLFIGMGTEVFVFFISAFDRPFDKTQDGRELATDSQLAAEALAEEQGGAAEGTIIIGASVMPNVAGGQPIPAVASVSAPASASAPVSASASASAPMSATSTAPTPAPAVTPETAQAMEEAMEEATTTYVDRLNELNELLLKVGAQTERITTDSEEMENLNRTLTGIARIYEMQLKSASQQINTQDEINEQTRKMAAQIAELNSIYARMIDAMKAGQNS